MTDVGGEETNDVRVGFSLADLQQLQAGATKKKKPGGTWKDPEAKYDVSASRRPQGSVQVPSKLPTGFSTTGLSAGYGDPAKIAERREKGQ